MFNAFKTAWIFLKCLCASGFSYRFSGVRAGRDADVAWGLLVWQTSRVAVINLLAIDFGKATSHWLTSPLCLRCWERWCCPAPRLPSRRRLLSFVARFWQSKTWVSQSHEAHCWKVGIVPLVALRRKREGRWLQHVVVDFVLKSVSFFSWWQEGVEYCKAGKLGLQMFWNPWKSLLYRLPGAASICSWRYFDVS